MEGTMPDGQDQPYVVTWRGSGRARLEGPAVVGVGNRTTHRAEFSIDPSQGTGNAMLAVTWISRDPSDPVRDVHVWLPGMEPTQGNPAPLFWPPFLEKLRTMNAGRGPETIRTLDWTRVNEVGRPIEAGGFRLDQEGVIRPDSPSQGTLRGVCTEYQVALCNELGANLHFQVPHRTDDLSMGDYLDLVARELLRIRDGAPGFPRLNTNLTVTLELSNEIWNPQFPAFGWMLEQAQQNGVPFREQVASEIQIVFDLAHTIFGGQHSRRLRTYVAGFIGDPSYLGALLARLRPGTQVDAVGAAAYLAPRQPDINDWLNGATPFSCPNCPGVDDLLAVADAAVDAIQPRLQRHAEFAASWLNPDGSSPTVEMYEAGLNMKSENRPWDQAAQDLQTRPEVFTLLSERLVPMMIEQGVSRVNWYSFMTDQNSGLVDTFGFWNDMNQEITLPVGLPYEHEGAPKASFLSLGPPPSPDCTLASATLRFPSGTVDSFRVDRPVMGQRIQATVDLSTTGHRSAYVRFTGDPTGLGLASDPASGELFPLQSGPLASWSVVVPNDPILAGLSITAQGVHVGRRSSNIVFSNEVVLTIGR
jgi:hypothetical protein